MHLKRRLALVLGLGVAAAGIGAWSALGGTARETIFFNWSQHRPAAGRAFVGLVIEDINQNDGFWGTCGKAFVARKPVQLVQSTIQADSGEQLVVCVWHVPIGAAGKRLRVLAAAADTSGIQANDRTFVWRIGR